MSFFSYNYFKNLKRPEVYLAFPNKSIIGAIHTYDMQGDIMANSFNKISFNVYKYEDNDPTKFYEDIQIGKYVHLYGIGWFRINESTIINEGNNEYKEISASSLECELGQTYLTSFGSLGIDSDEQGGLDRYCLYNKLDEAHSILHIFLQKNPGWSIKYVDPQISTEYRNFQEDSVDSYSFLTETVSKVYECVFIFDSYDRSVSAYKLENLGQDTNIILNYQNVIKSINMESSEDDIKTVLTVTGGNDERTNTPLGILDVNISGTNQIYNFSYYLSMMSDELQVGLKKYDDLCKQNESEYQEKMSSLLSHYDELNELKNKVPDEGEDSTDWTKFGLRELQEKEIIYKTNMSLYLNESDSELYKKNAEIHAAIEAEIKVREEQIASKQAEIEVITAQINDLVVNLPEVLGSELYAELGPFIREDTLVDDSFIATNSMTDREILEMQQALLKRGHSELEKICYPQFTLDVDLINFTVDYDYKRFTDALEMFNIIHINFENHNSIISARLLKLHINWDNPSDFKVTFSNRNSLKESWALFDEVKSQAEDASSKVEFQTGAWKNAAIVSIDVNKYMNNILDASKQQLVTNENNEVKLDKTGITCKKWIAEQQIYDPCQVWITSNQIAITHDSWNSVGLALGYVKMGDDYFFGLCADSIVGRLLMGQQLIISNQSGSYTIDDKGFTAKKDSYEVKINPDTPDNIFSISIDNKKLLYVDTTVKALTFEGKLISKSGQIASFEIADQTLTSGNIGLSSDKTSGAIAYWAGSTDRNNAPFRVSNTGAMTCSNANITGGSLKVGEHFSVNNQGILTASGASISGAITATSGRIGGWRIEGDELIGDRSSSYIRGGSINIGDSLFEANSTEVYLGEFCVLNLRRGQLSSGNEMVGMMANASGDNQAWLWAGANHDPYPFVVTGSGETRIAKIANTQYWQGYSLAEALDYIWTNRSDCGLIDLAERINYLENNMP